MNSTNKHFRVMRYVIVPLLAVITVFVLSTLSVSAAPPPSLIAQAVTGDTSVAVLPGTLSRLNIGAIVAASLVALIIELALNLLGIGIGANSINPKYGEDSSTPQQLGTGAIAWVAISTLVSLFVGGWLAGRFAGIPNGLDGLLHGLVTWALVTLISVSLLATTAGRILSGTTSLISQGLNLAGSTAGGVARGAAGIAQSVAQGAGGAVQGIAQGAGGAIQNAAQGASGAAQDAIRSNPDLANAANTLNQQPDQLLQTILGEGRKMLQQAGIDPNAVQGAAEGAVQEVSNAAKNVSQNPGDAERIFTDTLNRVLDRSKGVANKVDREAVLKVMAERGGMTPEQAHQQLQKWEANLEQARTQTEQTVQDAQRKAEEFRRDAEKKAAEVRREADRVAREVADATAKAVSRIALAAFAAILAGAIAASIGGAVGAPSNLPVAQISTAIPTPNVIVSTTIPATVVLTATPVR